MNIQRAGIFFFLILAVAFSSCEPNNPYDTGPPYDFDGNLAKDSLLIADYLETAEIDSLYRIHDPSGVVIIVQEEGTGSRPVNGNVIYTDYTGSLMSDGSVFETTVESVAVDNDLFVEGSDYRPMSFLLGGGTVVPGWTVAFKRLRPGSKAQLLIPSPYGYQSIERNRIPANSVLIYDMDFLGIE